MKDKDRQWFMDTKDVNGMMLCRGVEMLMPQSFPATLSSKPEHNGEKYRRCCNMNLNLKDALNFYEQGSRL